MITVSYTSSVSAAPADVLNAGGLNEKSLCQIEAARFLAHCALCLSSASGSHGDGDVMAEDGGDMASDVCETLIGLLEDHSKPVHIHIVRVFQIPISVMSLMVFSMPRLWGCFTLVLTQQILFSRRCWQA